MPDKVIPSLYIWIFLCQKILVKIIVSRCVIFSPSRIFAICRDLHGDLLLRLILAKCNCRDFDKIANLAKINHTGKKPNVL